ncbi:Leucine-rich repeat-containing protein 56, partial [Durusdinium trenchii]
MKAKQRREGRRRARLDLEEAQEELSGGDERQDMQASSFLIRPSPMARKARAFESQAQVWTLPSEVIEKEFLEIDMLTDDKLRKLAAKDDLESVTDITFRVDTTDQSISQLGLMLPNLVNLTLDKSIVSSFRDFGTHLRSLQVLHLSASHVNDLDGISALDALTELFLANNHVKSLTPLAMHEHLRVLDLRGNMVTGLDEVDQLGTCLQLRELVLAENPVARIEPYRRVVFQFVPQLKLLDQVAAAGNDLDAVGENLLENLSTFLEQLEDHGDLASPAPATSSLGSSSFAGGNRSHHVTVDGDGELIRARPSTPRQDTISSSSVRRSTTALVQSPSTRSIRVEHQPGSEGDDQVQAGTDAEQQQQPEDRFSASSELTHGAAVIFAGNLAASMRKRKKAARLETNQASLKRAAEKLEAEEYGDKPEDPLTPRQGDADCNIQSKLEELLSLSTGLEKEFQRLQASDTIRVESPKSKLLRRKAKATSQKLSSAPVAVATPRDEGRRRTRRPEGGNRKTSSSSSVLARRHRVAVKSDVSALAEFANDLSLSDVDEDD